VRSRGEPPGNTTAARQGQVGLMIAADAATVTERARSGACLAEGV